MMKKNTFLIAFAIASSTLFATPEPALAQSDDEILPPIVFFILDTSGSMNKMYDKDTNNTRMTNALAEIIGGSKNTVTTSDGKEKIIRAACGEVGDEGQKYDDCMATGSNSCLNNYTAEQRAMCNEFKMPIPKLTDNGNWQLVPKTIPINSKIAKPNYGTSSYVEDIESSYADDGIIQNYKKIVKFGFSGFAIGSTGSTDEKDSPIKQAAQAAGGNVNGILRFTLIWGDDITGTKQNTSDLDSHLAITNPPYSGNNYIYYPSSSKCSMTGQCNSCWNALKGKSVNCGPDGVLDVDNTNPYGYRGSWSVQMKENGPWVGVENIIFENSNNMKVGETFNFKVHNYRIAEKTNGFTVEVAFKNTHGCVTSKKIKYNKSIDSGVNKHMYDVITLEYIGNDNFRILRYGSEMVEPDATISGEDNSNSPQNIYGYSTNKVGDITYGRLINDKYKTSKDCSFDMGIWDSQTSSEDNAAPLIYPTSSDNENDIIQSNQRLIQVIRTYRAGSATPIGESLADVYFMFGGDGTADEGLIKSYTAQNNLVTDDKFFCDSRSKSVILVSDGDPNGSGLSGDDDKNEALHGHSKEIWHDAYHLYKSKIDVYVIGYSDEFQGENANPTVDGSAAQKLNLAAWKGGTCRDEKGEIIDPDNKDDYDAFVAKYDTHNKTCFYNAVNKNQLRIAIVNALSEVTGHTVSKTPVVTTTATSFYKDNSPVTNYANGFYNIYSGYQTHLGNQRDSFLYRSGFMCNAESGEFEQNDDYSIDMAGKLNNFIVRCRAGKTETPSATPTGAESGSASTTEIENTCLQTRTIFMGDYSQERNKLFPDNAKLFDPNETDDIKAGWIKDGGIAKDSSGNVSGKKDYHFLTEADAGMCAEKRQSLASDYIVSPYDCYSELQCGVDSDGYQMICDRGRCMSNADYNNIHDKNICFKHSDCSDASTVCHHGECVAGTLYACDVRQYIASQRLGVIEYATPTVVEAPNRAYKEGNYMMFKNTYWDRDTMLLVAANDGMLHNFILGKRNASQYDSTTSKHYGLSEGIAPETAQKKEEGDELWGFMPKSILAKAGKLTSPDLQTNVNATLAVADVRLNANSEYLKNNPLYAYVGGVIYNPPTPLVWRTVAVGGFRDGGRGYYALDITEPANPKILWEIDPLWQSIDEKNLQPSDFAQPAAVIGDEALKTNYKLEKTNKSSPEYYPFLQLGKTYAQPIITTMMINDIRTPVAILSGGLSNDSASSANHIGKTLYIVRLFPDKPEDLLVKTFYFEKEITGAPAVYPNSFNTTAQHIYVGDEDGAIYRLRVNGNNPDNWGSQHVKESETISGLRYEVPVFSPKDIVKMGSKPYEQITHKPAVSMYQMANNFAVIQIAVGTGSNDNLNIDKNAPNYAGVFFDIPIGNNKYSFNKDNENYRSKVIAFNPTDKVSQDTDYSYTNDNVGAEEDGTPDRAQYMQLYLSDPSPNLVTTGTPQNLSPKQKVTGPAIIYNYDAYFPVYQTEIPGNTDQCQTGQGLIYKLADRKSYNRMDSSMVQSSQNSDDVSDFNNNKIAYLPLGVGTKVYGLQITNQMYCHSNKGGKFSPPQLVAQTGAKTKINGVSDGSGLIDKDTGGIQTFTMNLDTVKADSHKMKWAAVYE